MSLLAPANVAPDASTLQENVSQTAKGAGKLGKGKHRKKRTFNRAFGADLTNVAETSNNAPKRRKTQQSPNATDTKKSTQRTQQSDDLGKPQKAVVAIASTKDTVSAEIEAQIIKAPERRVWDLNCDDPQSEELLCHEYTDEMMADLLANEISEALTDFMKWQTDLVKRMRKILVNWLIEVHHKFHLEHYTLFLGINLLDRYLCIRQLTRHDLQLCGSTCLYIAAKYAMILAPTMDDFVFIADDAFTAKQMYRMEMDIVKSLSFRMTVSTTLQFGERYYQIVRHYLTRERECKIIKDLIFYCLEQCLISYSLSRKPPSVVAAACLLFSVLATNVTSLEKLKADNLQGEFGHSLEAIKPVMVEIHHMMLAAMNGKKKAVYKKWSTPERSKISKLKFDKLNSSWLHKPL